MNYRALASAAVVAIFLISASSALFADSGDAAEMKEGENGIGFSVKDMPKEEQDKLILPSTYNGIANYILGLFLDDLACYDISSADMTDYELSRYAGDKISGKVYECVNADSDSGKISFVATCNSDDNILFDDDSAFADVMKAVGLSNKTQNGAKFTVTAENRDERSNLVEYTYEKNSAGNLILMKERIRDYAQQRCDIEVKYSYTSGDAAKEIEFEVSYGQVVSLEFTNTYDFAGVAISDVTSATRCTVDQDVDTSYRHDWLTCKYDGEKKGRDVTDTNFEDTPEYIWNAYDTANEIIDDMTVSTYDFYQSGADISLFGSFSNIDASLRSNDAMKQFLEKNGSITETYSGAESGAEAIYDDMFNIDGLMKILGIVGIVFLLFVVAVIVLIVILVKANKKR